MSKITIKNVADSLNISVSTVSRVLNHSFGASTELRNEVFNAADAMGFCLKSKKECDVHIILPETPTFFWRTLYEYLETSFSANGISVKFHIYSNLSDSQTVERYLGEAGREHARVIIIAAQYDTLDSRLSKLAKECLVLSVCENSNADGIYVIESNQKADGAHIARQCLYENPNINNILLIGSNGERLSGFVEAIGTKANIRFLASSQILPRSPSDIAQKLHDIYAAYPFDCAVSLSGNTKNVCIALKKCRLNITCYGFEDEPIEERYMISGGTVIQDLKKISEKAALIAQNYLKSKILPKEKYTYIPSIYKRT